MIALSSLWYWSTVEAAVNLCYNRDMVKMTPLLRSLVASRYYTILNQMKYLTVAVETDWENLSRFFDREEFSSTTEAVKAVWDLVDAIPLTD